MLTWGPPLKQLSIVSLCHVSVTNATLPRPVMTAFMTTLKLFYGFDTEELFWFHNQIATNILRRYLCLRLFSSAKRDQTSPRGEIPHYLCFCCSSTSYLRRLLHVKAAVWCSRPWGGIIICSGFSAAAIFSMPRISCNLIKQWRMLIWDKYSD